MASLHKKRIGKNVYWYARECKRIDGKPKIVWQQYLGRADAIVDAVRGAESEKVAPTPREVRNFEFGASAAVYDLLQELDFEAIVDRHVPKRGRGPTVGQYLAVAVVNRCVAPCSKAKIAEWFEKTLLARLMPLSANQLSSQRFWDNMDRVSEDAICAIERELIVRVVKAFDLDLRRLLFDATNFFTFIDTFNERSTLAQRGKSKEGRAALRIVGVALLVTADFHVPLLHHTYPGNQSDSPTFASLIEQLVRRYREITTEAEHVTLVFDKGNNSRDNLDAVEESPYHFVGSLVPTQHADLLEIPQKKFHSLAEEGLEGIAAYRTSKKVFGVVRTVVVTFNDNLFLAQTQTVMTDVAKRTQKLKELQLRLRARRQGRIVGGQKPTVASVQKTVDAYLKRQHMKKLIRVEVTEQDGFPMLRYRFDRTAWQRLQRILLGKSIFFTDNDDWSSADIVRAYHGQATVEDAFRCMKNVHHIALRPSHHWTDQKVKVHVLICVVALMAASLLHRRLHRRGIVVSLPRMLELLGGIQESVVVYSTPGEEHEPVLRTLLSSRSDEQEQLMNALDLARYCAS
jgi:transposase